MKLTSLRPKKYILHGTPEYKKNKIKFENFYKFFGNYKHFNMLSINAFKIIGPYVYTNSIDLTDAFCFLYLYILHINI